MGDLESIKTDWAAGNYTLSGGDAADAVNILLGPVPANGTSDEWPFEWHHPHHHPEHPEDLLQTIW